MHVQNAKKVIGGKSAFQIESLVRVQIIPSRVYRKEQGQFGAGIQNVNYGRIDYLAEVR